MNDVGFRLGGYNSGALCFKKTIQGCLLLRTHQHLGWKVLIRGFGEGKTGADYLNDDDDATSVLCRYGVMYSLCN